MSNDKTILELHDTFNLRSTRLQNSIIGCNNKDELNELRLQVIELNKLIETNVNKLPTYDKKRCIEIIGSLFKYIDIRNNLINSKKFKFKGHPIPSGSYKKINSDNISITKEQLGPLLSNVNQCKETIDTSSKHVLITNITNSIITSATIPYSIHIRQGHNSVISLECNGPIFIHNLSNVLLILRCHQLRLHNVHDSTILVQVANNRVIMENCKGLKFGNYSECSGSRVEIDDFNYPTKQENNAHFDYLSLKEKESLNYKWIYAIEEGLLPDSVTKKLSDLVK